MKYLLIIISLVVTQLYPDLLSAQSCGSVAQIKTIEHYPFPVNADTVLLADETILTYSKTEAKIHCSNESVFNDLFKTHGTLFRRFRCTWKTDRHGRYKDYSIYLSKEDAELIKSWAKKYL